MQHHHRKFVSSSHHHVAAAQLASHLSALRIEVPTLHPHGTPSPCLLFRSPASRLENQSHVVQLSRGHRTDCKSHLRPFKPCAQTDQISNGVDWGRLNSMSGPEREVSNVLALSYCFAKATTLNEIRRTKYHIRDHDLVNSREVDERMQCRMRKPIAIKAVRERRGGYAANYRYIGGGIQPSDS